MQKLYIFISTFICLYLIASLPVLAASGTASSLWPGKKLTCITCAEEKPEIVKRRPADGVLLLSTDRVTMNGWNNPPVTLTVATNSSWSLVNPASWLITSITSGTGTQVIRISATDNLSAGSRMVNLLFLVPNGLPEVLNVTQNKLEPPSILVQPVEPLGIAVSAHTYSVVASGGYLMYQWQLNGVNITDATSATYTLTGLDRLAHNGKTLRVIVSNPSGSVLSNPVEIMITYADDRLPGVATMPLYNCNTGAMTFQTTERVPSLNIQYQAIGITDWTAKPDHWIEQGLRADPKPVLLTVSNNGYVSDFTFDLVAACKVPDTNKPPQTTGFRSQTFTQGRNSYLYIPAVTFIDPEGQPVHYSVTGLPDGLSLTGNRITGTTQRTGVFAVKLTATDPGGLKAEVPFLLTVIPEKNTPLVLLPPLYNCLTGELTFRSAGGDGSTVYYRSVGITNWTTSTGPFIVKPFCDVQPFRLEARQSGNVETSVSTNWDYILACPANCPERESPYIIEVCGKPYGLTGQPLSGSAIITCGTDMDLITVSYTGGLAQANTVIEWMAIGITGWIPECSIDLDRNAPANFEYTINVRQRNKTTGSILATAQTRLKYECPRNNAAGRSAPVSEQISPDIRVAGNPTLDEAVDVTMPGTGSFRIQVCNASGQVIHNLVIDRQKEAGPVRIPLGKQAGLYLLRVETGNQPPKIVKVIRQ